MNPLTAPELSYNNESANNLVGAVPALAIYREKGVICFWAFQLPAESLRREAQGRFLQGLSQLCGLFVCPQREKTCRRLTMTDRIEAADRLTVCAAKLSFITDIFSQDEIRTFRFSEDGMSGFYFVVSEIEQELSLIAKEV